MENKYYVYKWIRLDNNTVFYIGKGTGRRNKKMSSRSKEFLDIYNNVECKCEIIKDNLSEFDAYELEKQTINELLKEGYTIELNQNNISNKHLVNKTIGGCGIKNYKHTDEAKKEISKHAKEIWQNEEYREKRIQQIREISNTPEHIAVLKYNAEHNENYGMKNKKHSEESKKKMSDSHKGKSYGPLTQEHKDNLSKSKMGHTVSQETRDRISETLKGKMTGSKNGNSKKIICNETQEIFECSRDACRKYNILPSSMCGLLKSGKKLKRIGLSFSYYKNDTCND